MSLSPSHYFIYYPVRVGLERDLTRALFNFQADIAAATGIAGRVLRKADDPWTWMEIYENVFDVAGFEEALGQAVERHGLARFLEENGRRHVERFLACA